MPLDNYSVIALDYGEKRIGVAIASWAAKLARPYMTLSNDDNLLSNLKDLIKSENVNTIVVGYPRNLEGQTTNQTKAVDNFIGELAPIGLPIKTQDESLTSVHAEAELSESQKGYNKADVDALAATYILEDYLNSSLER